MRSGSGFARNLFLTQDESMWFDGLYSYDRAITNVARKKGSSKLPELDAWWRNELFHIVNVRSERYITEEELCKIMQWKLGRGKDRPMLLNLIKQNSGASIIKISKEAFIKLKTGDWKGSMTCLMELRGVGPATASAILANFDPFNCPFMADEVIESTTNKKRDYTMKMYENMRAILLEKLKTCKFQSDIWTPELLGRALWARAVTGSSGTSLNDTSIEQDDPISKTCSLKRNVCSGSDDEISNNSTTKRRRSSRANK